MPSVHQSISNYTGLNAVISSFPSADEVYMTQFLHPSSPHHGRPWMFPRSPHVCKSSGLGSGWSGFKLFGSHWYPYGRTGCARCYNLARQGYGGCGPTGSGTRTIAGYNLFFFKAIGYKRRSGTGERDLHLRFPFLCTTFSLIEHVFSVISYLFAWVEEGR